ncbi:sugar nucleotide-binding protein [Pseudomonas luteola]|uniref:sugar nucleotide-binding protein n=1 Tax=Pseudomonas luteola TaxID=47886 RepID=UPI0012394CBB|nr:sugar nucleotide-binding protein [Pseudomonas luteola]
MAAVTQQIVERYTRSTGGEWGIYHLVSSGETSWFGFTQLIAEKLAAQGITCAALSPIPSSDYPTPAKRPANSRLDCSKIKAQWSVTLPSWQAAFSECWMQHFQGV